MEAGQRRRCRSLHDTPERSWGRRRFAEQILDREASPIRFLILSVGLQRQQVTGFRRQVRV